MKKVLFIGLGHMGSSLIRGILKNPNPRAEIYGYDAFKDLEIKLVQELPNLKLLKDLSEIDSLKIDVIVIGTRPDAVGALCAELKQIDLTNKTIICMANSVSIAQLSSYFGEVQGLTIIRMMPNMNAALQMSVTAIAHNNQNIEHVDFVVELFKACGIVELIAEEQFGVFTAISGCLPAYVFTFFKGIVDFAQANNFGKAQAFRIVETAIIGSVKNGATSNIDLQTMINNICVPNGSTIEGQKVLEADGFAEILQKCLAAATKKASH